MSRGIFHSLVARNADGTGDGFDDLFELAIYIAAIRCFHFRGLNLINELAFLAGDDNDACEMRNALDGFVFIVEETRGEEDKKENQRHHDVVVQAAPLVRPKDVSADCAPDRAHRRDSAIKRWRCCFGLLPVYLGIHMMAN